MEQIFEHPWMQGEIPSQSEVDQEFKARLDAVRKVIDDERQQKMAEKQVRLEKRKVTH